MIPKQFHAQRAFLQPLAGAHLGWCIDEAIEIRDRMGFEEVVFAFNGTIITIGPSDNARTVAWRYSYAIGECDIYGPRA